MVITCLDEGPGRVCWKFMKSDAQAAPDKLDCVGCCSIPGNDTGAWWLSLLTTGSTFLRLAKSNESGGLYSRDAGLEVEKKLAASLRFSLDTGLVCVRKV